MALSLNRYTTTWDVSSKLNDILKKRNDRERKRATTFEITLGYHLPEHLIVEILSWLPVKALLRFQAVCRSWCTLIKSLHFISKHVMDFYNNNETHFDCVIAQYHVTHAESQLCALMISQTHRVIAYQTLSNLPEDESTLTYICGSCNGIFYLRRRYSRHDALWNPAINDYKALPPIPQKLGFSANRRYEYCKDQIGFGQDPITLDYKVIMIRTYEGGADQGGLDPIQATLVRNFPSIFIYTLSTDSWRYWGDIDRFYELSSPYDGCVHLSGKFYWLVYSEWCDPRVALSFDMATDSYLEIQLPNHGHPTVGTTIQLGAYHDSLALFMVHKDSDLEVWTLNGMLWSKKFTVELSFEVWKVIVYWKNNKVLAQCRGGLLISIDLETQQITSFEYHVPSMFSGLFVYKESLVPVSEGKTHLFQEKLYI